MRKTISISKETHKALIEYCNQFKYKIGEKADQIIADFLLKMEA